MPGSPLLPVGQALSTAPGGPASAAALHADFGARDPGSAQPAYFISLTRKSRTRRLHLTSGCHFGLAGVHCSEAVVGDLCPSSYTDVCKFCFGRDTRKQSDVVAHNSSGASSGSSSTDSDTN